MPASVSYMALERDNPRQWDPAQLLRKLLEDIEDGEFHPDKMVIVWNEQPKDGPSGIRPRVAYAGTEGYEALGVMRLAMCDMEHGLLAQQQASEDDE